MELSVILLSFITNDDSKQLLTEAIDSLTESLNDLLFEIIVVESGDAQIAKSITKQKAMVVPYEGIDFNFHQALNQGYRNASGRYICFSNNDVVFHKNWFQSIKDVLLNGVFQSASPVDPNDDKLWMFDTTNVSFIEGYEIQKFFKGWCFVIEKKAMITLGGFDERFSFYFADNDFILELLRNNIRHAAVLSSYVEHRDKVLTEFIDDLDELKKINGDLFHSIPKGIIRLGHWWKIQNEAMTIGLISFHKKWGSIKILNKKIKITSFLIKNKLGFLNKLFLSIN